MKTTRMISRWLLAIMLAASFVNAQTMSHDHSKTDDKSVNNAVETFKKFQSLVGKWKATTAKGATAYVEYELVSNGTALHERFIDEGNKEDSNLITMYYVDRNSLMATHFCALNNQPRYRAIPDSPDPK